MTEWIPQVDQESVVQIPPEYQEQIAALELVPPEHQPWFLVKELHPAERPADDRYFFALKEMSPEAGSYVLMSLRRREIRPVDADDE